MVRRLRSISFVVRLLLLPVFLSCAGNFGGNFTATGQVPGSILNSEIENYDPKNNGSGEIVRLLPEEFTELPGDIIRDLNTRECLIPQLYGRSKPHNVISGEFKRAGSKDWAILCSTNDVVSILVYWESSAKDVSEIFSEPESDFLQVVDGDGTMGFSRAIDVVGEDHILDHYRSYGGPEPPKIDHDGISDAFVEKASVVLYLHNGSWIELQGAD